MKPAMKLRRDAACVVIVDIQERLAAAMPPDSLARAEKYALALIETGKALGLPVLATEQYPQGLGPLLPKLRSALPSPPTAKVAFSCAGDSVFARDLAATGRKQVILAGMETHVCVFQTARDLARDGYEVYVCADAVSSRTEEHRRVGLDLCASSGAVISTAETIIFDLLGQAGTPEFKRLSALVK